MQPRDAFDLDAVGPGAGDPGAHRNEAAREIDDFGLARRVLERRRALGETSRHQQILGAGHGDQIENEPRARKPPRARADVAVLEIDLGAHRDEAFHVLVDGTQADRATAGKRYPRLAAARHERPQREDRRAHRLDELVGRERPIDTRGVEREGPGLARVVRDAHLGEQRQHRPHVVQPRDVGEDEGLGRQQRGA